MTFIFILPIIVTMGLVYLLCELGDTSERYKIGVTRRDVEQRMKEHTTGNSNPIHLVDKYESDIYIKIESWLHRKYGSCKTVDGGTEWFNLPDEDVIKFSKTCKEVEAIIRNLMENNHFFD